MKALRWLFFTAVLALQVLGCSGGDYGGSSDYDNNMFYTAQPSAPKRDKRVNIDFFNKECKATGTVSSYSGKEYECHYTSD